MDYKTTYTHFFKSTQNRLSNVLQSQLLKYQKQGRPFKYVNPRILGLYESRLAEIKEKWNYKELKPIIEIIGLKKTYYLKHALRGILSIEVKEEFEKLELEIPYKHFIAQLAQLQAIDEGFINYSNNWPYFDRCYQTNAIEKITLYKIEDGYNNLDDFHERGKKLKMDSDIGIIIAPTDNQVVNTPGSADFLEPFEKVIILRTLFNLKTPVQDTMHLSEFARLMYLTSGVFDENIYNAKKIGDYGPYRKLGDHINTNDEKVKNSIKALLRKLKSKQVPTISSELRKLTL